MVKAPAIEDELRNVPLFSGLSKRDLRALASDVREQWFNPGDVIVAEGRRSDAFFVIAEGRARLEQTGKRARVLGPGSYFGEMSLLDGQARSATVRADGRVRTLQIASWSFLAVLEENWTITRKILATLSQRVRAAEGQPTL